MSYLFEPLVTTVPIRSREALFPVRRVYCVGRNYAAHAREMGADPAREPPFFFSKPADAVVPGGEVAFPPATEDYHHEVELVVALGRDGAQIPVAGALECVFGYAVGLDMTRRDLQGAAKAAGKPWDLGKGADASAPLSAIVPVALCGHPARGAIGLSVNGVARQHGDLAQMSWSVAEVVARLSQLVRLAPGDLIFTGTPEGVGPVRRGDAVHAAIEGVGALDVRFV